MLGPAAWHEEQRTCYAQAGTLLHTLDVHASRICLLRTLLPRVGQVSSMACRQVVQSKGKLGNLQQLLRG